MTHEILLQHAANEAHKTFEQREPKQGRVRALLGDGAGNLVGPSGDPWVLARLYGDNSRLVQAYNGVGVTAAEDVSVILLIRYTKGRVTHYEVERLSNDVPWAGYDPGASGGVSSHAISHEWRPDGTGGWDAVMDYPRARTELRLTQQDPASLSLYVGGGYYVINGVEHFFAGGTVGPFTAPGAGTRYDVVTISATGTLAIQVGALSVGPPVVITIPAAVLPIGAVQLSFGQTEITEDWLVQDVRPFLSWTDAVTSATPTGPAGGDLSGTYPNPTVRQSSIAFALNGTISPASLGADQNDYNPTGLSTANTLRLSSSLAVTITGLQGGAGGRILLLHNVGAFPITLANQSSLSTATRRFALPADVILVADSLALLQYDATSDRWRIVAGSSGSESGAGSVGHEHGLDRWEATAAQTVFDLTSLASQIEICNDNGTTIDPFTYTLSADGSQVTMDSGITAGNIVTVNYIVAQV